MSIDLISGGTVKVSSPTPSFTQVRPPTAPNVLVLPTGLRGPAGPAGGLTSVNGDTGPDVTLAAADVGAVPTTRTVNSKPLSADVTLAAADVGALPTGGTAAAATKLATARTIAGKAFDGTANVTLAASDVGAAANTLGAAEKVTALSATTGTATGDCSAASVFTVSPTGAITLAFSNVPATGTACTVTVIVTQGGTAQTVNLPTGGVWLGAAPTQTASKACVITLLTVNGGTTWYASAAVQA